MMSDFFSRLLDRASEYFAHRKGLLPLMGLAFVILNYIIQFFPLGWFGQSNLLLHLGIIFTIIGILLAWSL
ncbi:MAG: hypothetical protein ACUVRJ_05575 [Candidatus Villigracilaceae bacterium]